MFRRKQAHGLLKTVQACWAIMTCGYTSYPEFCCNQLIKPPQLQRFAIGFCYSLTIVMLGNDIELVYLLIMLNLVTFLLSDHMDSFRLFWSFF